jgi:hypothetical protein
MPDISSLINKDNQIAGSVVGLPTHRDYNNYIDHWKFLIRSYLGAQEYKRGSYLKRYTYESETEYLNRLDHAVVDNHVKAVTHIYNSFLYRQNIKRDFGSLEGSPELEAFLQDCDMEGRTWDSFIRDVNILSSVYGNVWVLVDRPETVVGTRAEELQQGIRPYVTMYSPENVLDWKYIRQPNGHYELEMISFLETDERPNQRPDEFYLRVWTKDSIKLVIHRPNAAKESIEVLEEKPNMLGKIPAVCVYANRGPIKGIGVSDIADVAHAQRFLHECYSEAEQLISLTNHPTLVKTRGVDASAGAGAIISMPEDLDPNLKPYLLQPDGGNLQAILSTMQETIQAIDKMSHLGSIRAVETRQMSGVAMQSEFLLLDARLSEKARNLQLSEEQIWRLYAMWQGEAFDGEIKYPTAFHIRDKNLDMDIIQKAATAQRDSATATPNVKTIIDQKVMEILSHDEDELEEMNNQMADTGMEHDPVTGAVDLVTHMREMIDQGMTNEDILTLHPELNRLFQGSNNGNIPGQNSNSQ